MDVFAEIPKRAEKNRFTPVYSKKTPNFKKNLPKLHKNTLR